MSDANRGGIKERVAINHLIHCIRHLKHTGKQQCHKEKNFNNNINHSTMMTHTTIMRAVHNNRSTLRLCIFIALSITLTVKPQPLAAYTGLLFALSVIVGACHISQLARNKQNLLQLLQKSIYSILFSLALLAIWLLS